MKLLSVLLALCLCTALVASVHADSTSETLEKARQHYLAGEKAFTEGDLQTAILEWETTLKLKPDSDFTKKRLAEAKAKLAEAEADTPKTEAKPSPSEVNTKAGESKQSQQEARTLVSVTYKDGQIIRLFKVGDQVVSEVENLNGESASSYAANNRIAHVTSLAQKAEAEKQEAWEQCKKLVLERLKAPSTANFPSYNELAQSDPKSGRYWITKNGPSYTIKAWVDSKNGFGAVGRVDFTCKLRPHPKVPGMWVSDSLVMNQR